MTDNISLSEVVDKYHANLLESEEGMEYYRTFGLEEATMKEFRLGWITEPAVPQHAGLVNSSVVPYLSVGDNVLGLRHDPFLYDDIGSYTSGWLGSDYPLHDTNFHLFNVRHTLAGLRTAETFLVSDVLSALLLRQQRHRVVAVPGFENWHHPWSELFLSASIQLVYNETDSLEASDVAEHLRRRQVHVRTVMLPRDERLYHHLSDGETVERIIETYGGV